MIQELTMRRIDIIGIGLGMFLAGGLVYLSLEFAGLDSQSAGIWSQFVLVGGVVGWLLTYLFRALTQKMTLNEQIKEYKDAVLQKQLEEMTPEELAKLQAEVEAEKKS